MGTLGNHLKHFLNYNKYGRSKTANMTHSWYGNTVVEYKKASQVAK